MHNLKTQFVYRFSMRVIIYLTTIVSIVILLFNVIKADSLSPNFDNSLVLQNQDLYNLPLAYSSASAIQAYFVSKGSLLANYYVPISFEADDSLIAPATFASKPSYQRPLDVVGPYFGRSILVSELIWKLSREDFGNGCGITAQEVCIDNRSRPINPAFLIALIQKESGTVYGANSKKSLSDPNTYFLLDRIVGYYCFENPDPAKSCYDQNPNWRFFKGFFRQIYYASRLLRIWEQRCQLGGSYSFVSGGYTYSVGQTVSIDGSLVQLQNGITCSMYIYTPHYSSQLLFYNIMKDLKADQDPIQSYNLKPGQTPKPVITGI